jgi:hypothetical protein
LAAGAGENWFAGRLAACYQLAMQTKFPKVGPWSSVGITPARTHARALCAQVFTGFSA